MLGVTGAWAQENLVGTPWFMAGEACTFDKCQVSYLARGPYSCPLVHFSAQPEIAFLSLKPS